MEVTEKDPDENENIMELHNSRVLLGIKKHISFRLKTPTFQPKRGITVFQNFISGQKIRWTLPRSLVTDPDPENQREGRNTGQNDNKLSRRIKLV